MNMNVSFKAQIPVSQCQLYDKQDKKFVPATLYEFDCKDISDIKHFKRDLKKWVYMESLICAMGAKFRHYREGFGESTNEGNDKFDGYKFYSLELPNNHIVGFCEAYDDKDNKNIYYLETERERRYKFAGQSIIASMAKQMISSHENPELTINFPARSARDFYVDKCGFEPNGKVELVMKKQKMSDFVKSFEEKTEKPILDLKA